MNVSWKTGDDGKLVIVWPDSYPVATKKIQSYWDELLRLREIENACLRAYNNIMQLQAVITQETHGSMELQKQYHAQLKRVNAIVPDAAVW